MLCVLILYIRGGAYSLKSIPNDRFFEETTAALAGIMPNLGDPSQDKMQLLIQVVRSIALYAAPLYGGRTWIRRRIE